MKSIRRWFRRQVRMGLDYSPDFIKDPIYKNMISLRDELPKELVFKTAETREEMEQAFELVYESYKEISIIDESDERMWVTKYQLMPTTSILIVKWKEQVVGTASIIIDSPLGLPCDEIADLSSYRKRGLSVTEVSSLAIHKDFRKNQFGILMPLFKYIYEYVYNHAGMDILIATIHKSARGYFRHVLQFEDLARKKEKKYSQVKDYKPVTLLIDLNQLLSSYYTAYKNQPYERNLHRYYKDLRFPNYNFGSDPIQGVIKTVMRPEYLDHFLTKTSLFKSLTDEQVKLIGSAYFYSEFKDIIAKHLSIPMADETRRSIRIILNKHIRLQDHGREEYFEAKLRDISKNGIKLRCERNIPNGTFITVHIMALGEQVQGVKAQFEVVWRHNCLFGCRVAVGSERAWVKFFDSLEINFYSREENMKIAV